MICPGCGRENPIGSRFCGACGSTLQQISESADNPILERVEEALVIAGFRKLAVSSSDILGAFTAGNRWLGGRAIFLVTAFPQDLGDGDPVRRLIEECRR